MSASDEIELLAADIKRWAGADARIWAAVDQLLKVHTAEVDALAFEAAALDKLLTRETTELEQARIRSADLARERRWYDR